MRHIDLFSGIGGFSLACEWAGIETILFCENDKFCQRILNKHWPSVPIVEDVNDKEEIKRIVTDTTNLLGYGSNNNTGISTQRETIPESGNGDRQGVTPDTRCQRQEKREEQAAGIIERDEVITNSKSRESGQQTEQDRRENISRRDSLLLTAGFPCQPFSGAGKRKGASDDRYLWPQTLAVIESVKPDWLILENVAGLLSMVFPDNATNVANQTSLFGNQDEEIAEYNTICGRIDSNLRQAGYETVWLVIPACSLSAPHRRDRVWIVANTTSQRQESKTTIRELGWERFTEFNERTVPDWKENWYEVATRLCRVDAGVPDRVDRLKSLGNAIVPQVAYQIIKAITGDNQWE